MFLKTIAFLAALAGADDGRSSAPPPRAPAATRVAQAPAAPSATRIVDRVQEFYRTTKHLSAKFRQTNVNATFGKTAISDGRVYLKKPGKMRWDYFSKRNKNQVSKTQISDGKTIWAVDFGGRWYYKESLSQSALPVAVTFLSGSGDLKKDFHAKLDKSGKWAGSKTDHVLELTPRQPSAQFKELFLVVDPSNYRVKHSIVINAAGDVNQFSFYEPNTARVLADGSFVFNPKSKAAKGFREIQPTQAKP
jgi:outer membrane lipoprotein carrier protein